MNAAGLIAISAVGVLAAGWLTQHSRGHSEPESSMTVALMPIAEGDLVLIYVSFQSVYPFTAAAGQVMKHLEFVHQCLRPDLDVRFVSVTEQWAQFAVAGPKSRELLNEVLDAPNVCDSEILVLAHSLSPVFAFLGSF